MSRGKLDKITANKIDESLPSVQNIQVKTLNFSPEFISIGFPPKSKIPIASVCLQDAASSIAEVRYALFEAIAHITWYRIKSKPSNEQLATFFGKFYVDDTALRMFAAKEHLTNALANALDTDLKELKKTIKNVDDLTRIGRNLRITSPNHPLINPIFRLIDSEDWKKTKKYRNDWVHNKPQMIKGLGINYERKNRLIVKKDFIGVTIGQGDEPKLSIDELLTIVKSAFLLLVNSLTEIIDYFIDYLNKNQQTEW